MRGKRRRSGFTLIEMMVVISILTVMMSLVGMTFHLLLRTEKLVSQSFVTERAISRLAVQFRDDVHQAETGLLTSDANPGKYELALGDSRGIRVRYAATEKGLVRLSVDRDQVVSREDYRLPECQISISTGQGDEASLRTLIIERPGATIVQYEQRPRPLRSLRIEAHLHRQALTEVNSTPPDNGDGTKTDPTEEQK
jgi:prepilin-type N-terminal cleavage/methylation domain-containing protein